MPEKAPFWMQRAIWSVGMRPHNVLVDITNYVMLALGQPLHGFDQDHVEDGIRVRTAHQDETLELLDESVLHLSENDLLICDGHDKPIGLAGVMGGARDSILPETTNMLLEIAHFDAQTIRKTVMRHHLRTEASNRFEKAIDTQRCDQALGLAQYLMATLQPGARIAAYGSARTGQTETLTVYVPLEFLCVRSGRSSAEDVRDTLESLGLRSRVMRSSDEVCKSPCGVWRATGDVGMRAIFLEVCRMIGYRLNHHTVMRSMTELKLNPLRALTRPEEYLAFRRSSGNIHLSLGKCHIL